MAQPRRTARALNSIPDSILHDADINAAAECELRWDVIPSHDNRAFTLIPHTHICAVDETHVHSEQKHSRFVVTKGRVVARCFSHDTQRTVTGAASRRLRELFFPSEFRDCFEEFMHTIMELCRGESFVRLGFSKEAFADWLAGLGITYVLAQRRHLPGSGQQSGSTRRSRTSRRPRWRHGPAARGMQILCASLPRPRCPIRCSTQGRTDAGRGFRDPRR